VVIATVVIATVVIATVVIATVVIGTKPTFQQVASTQKNRK
jgi:Na+-transporting NADH:ubiquinone oxidoreductase subunit NqrC